MFKRFGRQSVTKDPKKKQLWGKDFDIVDEGLDEKQVVSFVNDLLKQREESAPESIRSILRAAIVSAEKITSTIQKKAQAEAEDEAARIIALANQKAEGSAGKAEKEDRPNLEAVLSEDTEVPEEKTEETVRPAAEASGEPNDSPAQVQDEVAEEQTGEAARLPQEASVASSVELLESMLAEPQITEEKIVPEKTGVAPLRQDTQSLYTGEVQLSITKPVDPRMVSKLYNYLQTTPEIKFIRTSGSWDRGTTITVALDKPIALISVLSSKIPEAEVVSERPERDGYISGKKGVRSIKLTLKKEGKAS